MIVSQPSVNHPHGYNTAYSTESPIVPEHPRPSVCSVETQLYRLTGIAPTTSVNVISHLTSYPVLQEEEYTQP